jgi:hypothetical protein
MIVKGFSTRWQKLHVSITMIFRTGHDVVEHVGRALLEYMKKHLAELDEQILELRNHYTRGINELVSFLLGDYESVNR